MRKEQKGIILAILAAVFSGVAIPANKFFIVSLSPAVFTAVRALIIGVVFFAIASYQARRGHRSFKKVPWKYLIAIAVIGGAAAFLLYFTGLKLTTAGRAAFLYHSVLTIFTVVLAAAFLSERVDRRMAMALGVMLIGTIVLYVSQVQPSQLWSNPNLGDLLIIVASVLWAVEYVISRKAMTMGETNFVVSFARMFFGGLILFGFVIVTGNAAALLKLSFQQWTNIGVSTLLLFGDILCWYWSIRYINVSKASILLLLAPVISLVGGSLFLNEPAPLLQLAGSAVILIGAYIVIGVKSEQGKG
ncbi:MAG: DMT family transporter [Candidatus Micrarchaeota archaeon]|nr:DMT family transporter [Candidatus Micrarchaeota archaeon]